MLQGQVTNIPSLINILDEDLFNSLPEGPELDNLLKVDEAEGKQEALALIHTAALQGEKAITPLAKHTDDQPSVDVNKTDSFEKENAENRSECKAVYRIRDGVRSYSCEACGISKTTKAAVEAHIKKEHLLGKALNCEDCPYETWNPSCFAQHKKRCKSKLQCDFCSYCTTKTSDMKRHISRKHKDE